MKRVVCWLLTMLLFCSCIVYCDDTVLNKGVVQNQEEEQSVYYTLNGSKSLSNSGMSRGTEFEQFLQIGFNYDSPELCRIVDVGSDVTLTMQVGNVSDYYSGFKENIYIDIPLDSTLKYKDCTVYAKDWYYVGDTTVNYDVDSHTISIEAKANGDDTNGCWVELHLTKILSGASSIKAYTYFDVGDIDNAIESNSVLISDGDGVAELTIDGYQKFASSGEYTKENIFSDKVEDLNLKYVIKNNSSVEAKDVYLEYSELAFGNTHYDNVTVTQTVNNGSNFGTKELGTVYIYDNVYDEMDVALPSVGLKIPSILPGEEFVITCTVDSSCFRWDVRETDIHVGTGIYGGNIAKSVVKNFARIDTFHAIDVYAVTGIDEDGNGILEKDNIVYKVGDDIKIAVTIDKSDWREPITPINYVKYTVTANGDSIIGDKVIARTFTDNTGYETQYFTFKTGSSGKVDISVRFYQDLGEYSLGRTYNIEMQVEYLTSGINIEKYQRVNGSEYTKDDLTCKQGDTVDYKIVVTNTGEVKLEGVSIADSIPSEIAVDTLPNLNLGSLDVGASKEVVVSGTVNVKEGDISNTASVTCDEGLNEESNTVNLKVVPEEVILKKDLYIEKLQSLDGITYTKESLECKNNDSVWYRLDITNSGEVELNNITVEDILPGGLTIDTMPEMSISTLDVDDTESIIIKSTVNIEEGILENTASSSVDDINKTSNTVKLIVVKDEEPEIPDDKNPDTPDEEKPDDKDTGSDDPGSKEPNTDNEDPKTTPSSTTGDKGTGNGSNSGGSTSSSPKTGDTANIALYSVMLLVSLVYVIKRRISILK